MLGYPSQEDIACGLWLKHFACQLPAYATRYDLSALQVLQVQSMAGEYLDLLIWRLQHTTAGIRPRRALPLAEAQALAAAVVSYREYIQTIHNVIDTLVEHIQQHVAYTARDGQALQLSACPSASQGAATC